MVFFSGCLGEDESDVNSGNNGTSGSDGAETDEREDDGEEASSDENGNGDEEGESTEDSSDTNTDDDETGTDEEELDDDLDIEFVSCTRVEVDGSFTDGDLVYASTGFYDEGLYGNTLLEDGITFGEDVETPFSGTVVLEISDEASVEESSDEIIFEVPEYGSDGTVLTGLTTDTDDYAVAGITHSNPEADSCLEEIEAEESNGAFEVSELETNTPIDGGEYLEVTAEVQNVGDAEETDEVRLVVGHDAEEVDSQTLTIDAGETETVSLGYETPSVNSDQEFPLRVGSENDEVREDVVVYGSA
jgi:hypothetical protein